MQIQVSSELFYPKLGAMQKTKAQGWMVHTMGNLLLEIVCRSELSFSNIKRKAVVFLHLMYYFSLCAIKYYI